MIFDCFMFSNELEILELRLRELHDLVDRFILVEATRTHRGFEKPLLFAENRARFQPFLDKIVHVVVDDMPDHPDPWVRENFQRNAIARGLFAATDQDFVIIGDVDEIPRRDLVKGLATRSEEMVGFQMSLSCFKYNYVCVEGETMSVWSVATRARHVRRLSPQYFRDKRLFLQNAHQAGALLPEFFAILPHGGWHFGWIGDRENALRKMTRNMCHLEHYSEEAKQALDIDAIVSSGGDIFNRPGYRWQPVQLNDYFPATLLQRADEYAPNLLRNPP